MIAFDAVRVIRDGHVILDDISVRLGERRIGIIGANGSGKSTFVRLINGIEQPDGGWVQVDELDAGRDRKALRRRVGFVFQNPDNQIVYPLVTEDLAFGLQNLRLPKAEIQSRIEHFARCHGIHHLLERMTYKLSGGEKQLVALLGVLIMEPAYVVLDEPTTLLDLRNKKTMMEAILALPQPVIVVSHDLDFLASFERVLQFEAGRIVADGRPDQVIPRYIEQSLC